MEPTNKSKITIAIKPMAQVENPKAKKDQAQTSDGSASSEDDGAQVEIDLDAEDAWFLPFSWPQRKAPVPYKASDEDWTEFRNFSTNEQKKHEARSQAVGFIHHIVQQNQTINKILGPPVLCTKYWLDIDYPYAYSEGYEVNG